MDASQTDVTKCTLALLNTSLQIALHFPIHSHKHTQTSTLRSPLSGFQILLPQWRMRSQLHVLKQVMVAGAPSMAQSVELAGQAQTMESPILTIWAFLC